MEGGGGRNESVEMSGTACSGIPHPTAGADGLGGFGM